MKNPHQRLIFTILTLVLLGMACSTSALVPTAVPLPSATPTWTLLPPASPTPAPTDTPVPTDAPTALPGTATAEAFVCPGAPAPRVALGDKARVTFTNGLPLRVRDTPVVNNSNVTAQIAEGTAFTITDGPRCAPIPNTSDSFVYWKIKVDSTGLTGWVAEGDNSTYFIEKLP